MIWETCKRCGGPCNVVAIRTNGASYCSNVCRESAAALARGEATERAERTRTARSRALTYAAALLLTGLALSVAADQRGDETKEARERKSLYGRVSWDVATQERN